MPRRWMAAATLAMAVAACATPSSFTVSLPGGDGVRELPVTLNDPVGVVADVSVELGLVLPDAPIVNVPGRPDKVRVAWTGGACDRSVTMTLRGEGNAFVIAMATEVDPGSCDAIGIGRELMITFRRPVAAASVRLEPVP